MGIVSPAEGDAIPLICMIQQQIAILASHNLRDGLYLQPKLE
jgi:hypothetical protein